VCLGRRVGGGGSGCFGLAVEQASVQEVSQRIKSRARQLGRGQRRDRGGFGLDHLELRLGGGRSHSGNEGQVVQPLAVSEGGDLGLQLGNQP